jgi:predicted nuclease of predicted toxin-antitoxin system
MMCCDRWTSSGGGADDPAVFTFACKNDRIIVTFNNADFVQLAQRVAHPGVLLIYQDNKPSDMTAVEIVKALQTFLPPARTASRASSSS